jgi:hypothetical protein
LYIQVHFCKKYCTVAYLGSCHPGMDAIVIYLKTSN